MIGPDGSGGFVELPDVDTGTGDEQERGGPDLWRVAGALTVIGLALIGAAILANRVQYPVRLPEDDLAEQYREGYAAGQRTARAELEAEQDRVTRLESEIATYRDAKPTPEPTPAPVPVSPFVGMGETFGRVGAEDPPTP